MKKEEYESIVKKNSGKENKFLNMILAFFSGGLLGMLYLFIFNILHNYLSLNTSLLITTSIFIVVSSVLTGLHIFDKVASFFKAGIIVPITGFAHAMTAAAMDYREEGYVNGIGSNIFKLTGSIILYGTVSAIVFAFIKVVIL